MTGRVNISNLCFGYTGREKDLVFSKISFDLEQGEVFCLLGPNGSGKSTLLKCMARLLNPLEGSVCLDGENLNTLGAGKIARKIGFVPQSLVCVFPFTVEDIVIMGRASRIGMISSPSKTDRRKAFESMERIGISHLAKRPCNRLSGGEWQLVLIARALTQSPGVLLLDEPTSHLDLGNQIKILEVVDSLAKEGITIIMASHFPDHAFLNADKVGILKDRTMIALGDPNKVLSEDVLEITYGITIKIVTIDEGINRKICVPVLNQKKTKQQVKNGSIDGLV
ncbi:MULTISPECIES: ABC transporter ATP-binding protein [Desulfobacula]|uniref:Predicted ABC transporter ATP-binding protein n=2 Tax=Desulfobacula TaxID=28222 RepID=K0NE53_DESTT|nr:MULTISPECIES: ABC transporter ATP-binding protein [Desulfobacula]CCK79090.1 predicted ABC transporter ATP-binding protein [Desulfobacula toluolica Tol2]SDU07182.1 iron complex transport system ATP-binding protein [Desulfobacula phenolica]